MTATTTEISDRKGGAPANNRNRYRHGLYSSKTPDDDVDGMTYVRSETNKFRRSLEDLVKDEDGNVLPGDALLIIAITDWVVLGLWAALESSNHYSKLNPDQRLAYRREIPRSKNEAIKLMKQLGVQNQSDASWLPPLPIAQEAAVRSETEETRSETEETQGKAEAIQEGTG